ncbi:hypothetical protein J2Z31_001726 [Sinorhizobium kostiense]|uniref:Uncharacterized protein n=1 Tax=Sinorhizobium kostiense TaxID=76747 RepID=A0ABS4QXM4_9HYPH|nr:hypothetical protein [Sinorhizobium kostiense]MBP2235234.1 hypothetical protein [Sinorhizobium kostiense]
MTTKLTDERYNELYQAKHEAILLNVEKSVSTTEGAAINRSITEYLSTLQDADDMRPVWIRFADIGTANVYFLQSHLASADKASLAALVLAIEGVERFSLVSSFDFKTRQYPRKAMKKSKFKLPTGLPSDPNNKRITKKLEFYPFPDPNCLPLKLRFFSCEEAMREAFKLGDIYERWPFFGYDRDDLRVTTEKLVAEFAERYPYLAEADKVIGGKLTEVITELGKHPYQKPFELRRFWSSVKRGGVRSWAQLANELLAEVAQGAGNPYRHYEEAEEMTTATAHLNRDDRPRGDRTSVTTYAGFAKPGWMRRKTR